MTAATPAQLDDRTARARIRDAAIRCIAAEGVRAATVRKIAAEAGVSPGLVIHHFGSVPALRRACDEYVAVAIREAKEAAVAEGRSLDPLAALRDHHMPELMAYLSQVLVEDSPEVDRLVDDLVADSLGYQQEGIENGLLKPTDEPRARAAVLAIWSLGSLVLHRHAARILGVDLTSPQSRSSAEMRAYVRTVIEILSQGIYTDEFAGPALAALAATEKEAIDR